VAHCKKHLAGFKVPRAVVFGELPKTSTGKIQKFELRKQAGRRRPSTCDVSTCLLVQNREAKNVSVFRL
jgi:acyl-CoA synthetase (AMP-forming)/AMP-acid ligase II